MTPEQERIIRRNLRLSTIFLGLAMALQLVALAIRWLS